MKYNNDTMCPLPFMAMHDSSPDAFSPCCHIDHTDFKKYTNIKEYLQSKELKQLKENLTNGIKDKRCNYCWKTEELKMSSLRQQALNSERVNDLQAPVMKQIHIQTGYTCNISCMMCSPGVSSNLGQLWRNVSLEKYHNWWKGPVLAYRDDLENYIKQNLHEIKYIDASGGEPFYNKKYLALLDYLLENNANKHITLFVTTNGTQLNDRLCKKLLKFKKVVIMTSIDGIGAVNDYIRWGSNFSQVEKNFIKITKLFDHTIATCVSALNVHRYHEIKEFATAYDSQIDYVMVKDIPALNPCNVPDSLKADVCHEHKEVSSKTGNKELLSSYIRLWDKQRGIKITDYMPEFKVIIK
tara:strand:- start:876 stop:1937 length:1062 start_codon:yes stop_codon:yes gene_type:complete